jgi:hypothetical protein
MRLNIGKSFSFYFPVYRIGFGVNQTLVSVNHQTGLISDCELMGQSGAAGNAQLIASSLQPLFVDPDPLFIDDGFQYFL